MLMPSSQVHARDDLCAYTSADDRWVIMPLAPNMPTCYLQLAVSCSIGNQAGAHID
jgi:hypothetical protein